MARLGPLRWNYVPGHFWVRLFGWGLLVKDTQRHPLVFFERDGRTPVLRLGRFLARCLPSDTAPPRRTEV